METKLSIVKTIIKSSKKKKHTHTLWPLFMDGVQLPQGYSHFKDVVYFLPISSQKFLVLIPGIHEERCYADAHEKVM